ncbi:peptidoglycan/LPS O-acetylase OafA/YrhL [Curtobacterium herbarum]|uniref:acyltransferase family protein n=1 Tax=Curtobacterium herbarum TaxID=150122 RepID=UPI0020A023C7|nr:acyltransferase [Curtobacterium herbarum]MCP1501577.1 peptidoglycan/LPS O-acetylase OafA/YrhL [Curtobacterium herbarum]
MSVPHIPALDGARGLAAVGVLVHHVVLVWAPHTRQAYAADTAVIDSPLPWLLAYTPLHLPWLGTANVLVFFALSGFVLVRPFLERSRPSVIRFWTARSVRLYLPAWGSIVIAVVVSGFVASAVGSDTAPPTIRRAAVDALLLPTYVSNEVNGVLWSLAWEVAFSVAVPGIAVGLRAVLRLSDRRAPVATALLVAVPLGLLVLSVPLSDRAGEAALYSAVFLGGTALATAMHARPRHAPSPIADQVRPAVTTLVVIGLAVALCARWLVLPSAPQPWVLQTADAVSAAGSVGVVWFVVVSAPTQRLLSTRVAVWTGRLSFSMYLTHAVVLEGVWALSGGAVWAIPIALIVVWIVATAFRWSVEKPSHAVARRVMRSKTVDRRDLAAALVR